MVQQEGQIEHGRKHDPLLTQKGDSFPKIPSQEGQVGESAAVAAEKVVVHMS